MSDHGTGPTGCVAVFLKEPASYPYGMREFNVEDPDGNTIIYGSPDATHA